MVPPSVIRIARTHANTGRSMKNCGMGQGACGLRRTGNVRARTPGRWADGEGVDTGLPQGPGPLRTGPGRRPRAFEPACTPFSVPPLSIPVLLCVVGSGARRGPVRHRLHLLAGPCLLDARYHHARACSNPAADHAASGIDRVIEMRRQLNVDGCTTGHDVKYSRPGCTAQSIFLCWWSCEIHLPVTSPRWAGQSERIQPRACRGRTQKTINCVAQKRV